MLKTHHIISYALQLFLWVLFVSVPLSGKQHIPYEKEGVLLAYIVQHVSYFVFFYFNYFLFIPKYLYRKNLKTYILLTSLAVIVLFLFNNTFDFLILHFNRFLRIGPGNIVPIIQVYAVSTMFRLLVDQIEVAINRKILVEEKTRAELNYLRSQVNPHFLFNTLNNIAALIHIDPDKAEAAVIKLSTIMRAMLSTGQNKKISLEQEIELINSYIELQKIRLNEDTRLEYSIVGSAGNLLIEPLILINFIENVFKHGLMEAEGKIRIDIKVEGSMLQLVTENFISTGNKDSGSGIGLENVKKRLSIVYPAKHDLIISNDGTTYTVNLTINLADEN